MFIGSWLSDGLAEVLAPNENPDREIVQEDTANSSFWQFVAPDKGYEDISRHGIRKPTGITSPPVTAVKPTPLDRTRDQSGSSTGSAIPPQAAFDSLKQAFPETLIRTMHPSALKTIALPQTVHCEHCHRVTRVTEETIISKPKTPQDLATPPLLKSRIDAAGCSLDGTPSAPRIKTDLEERVLSAARGWAMARRMPRNEMEKANRIFKWAGTSINEKQVAVFRRYITEHPHLLHVRAHNLGEIAADAFTPLMAASKNNHFKMVKLIIESDETTLQDTDLEGRRPVHIAAVYGSLDVLRLLNTTDVYGENAPLDLAGRTPYGCAKLSGVVSAKRNQGPLDQVLFSPLDPSVKGKPTPHRQRSHRQGEDDLPYGFAQMPGKRVYQEDSVGVHPMPLSSSLLISVCDGHEDNGEMSRYLADNAWDMYSKQPEQLPIEQRWREASLAMDQQLKLKKRRGGSTGVFCLISSNQVVVANVGDCRVILIQKITASNQTTTVTKDNTKEQPVKETEKDQKEEGDHAKTEQEAPPALVEEDSDSTKSFGVITLSDDHKPSLPTEKQRIEAAGLNVKIDSYTDTTGLLQTVYRADLGNGQSLAVSRAFGDFDYKGNTNFSVEEQAIIAIPDVTIHDRTQEDMYVVLACDGIWDVMSNDDVAEFIVEHTEEALKKDESEVLAKVSDKLVAHCLEKGSEDNMSVAIVALSSTSKRIAASGEDNQIRGKTLFK